MHNWSVQEAVQTRNDQGTGPGVIVERITFSGGHDYASISTVTSSNDVSNNYVYIDYFIGRI
jgi:hypothetical protein